MSLTMPSLFAAPTLKFRYRTHRFAIRAISVFRVVFLGYVTSSPKSRDYRVLTEKGRTKVGRSCRILYHVVPCDVLPQQTTEIRAVYVAVARF